MLLHWSRSIHHGRPQSSSWGKQKWLVLRAGVNEVKVIGLCLGTKIKNPLSNVDYALFARSAYNSSWIICGTKGIRAQDHQMNVLPTAAHSFLGTAPVLIVVSL